VVEYLGADLDEGGLEFIPTAELVTALGIDRATLSKQLTDLGCKPTRERIPTEDGTLRQVRGYLVTDIRTAAQAIRDGHLPDTDTD
jgi:S-DNA-T family DNA segregation ATPase FtsK/SpoIIIE